MKRLSKAIHRPIYFVTRNDQWRGDADGVFVGVFAEDAEGLEAGDVGAGAAGVRVEFYGEHEAAAADFADQVGGDGGEAGF